MSLADKLRAMGVDETITQELSQPVWSGPASKASNGGITFSLLSKYLVCRERFRLLTIEGLKAREGFNHKLEYGNMWHLCEENIDTEIVHGQVDPSWLFHLRGYVLELSKKYPYSVEEIDKWYNVCRIQFPIYMKFWENHPDAPKTISLFQEEKFCVPYILPSGRTVYLRGKWDRVHLISHLGGDEVWLQENKTKGDIDVERVYTQLNFDLQTMLYLIALETASTSEIARKGWTNTTYDKGIHDIKLLGQIKGVIYNVVRRPLSGGTGTIIQKQNETKAEYYKRLQGYIDGTGLDGKKQPTPGPKHYFMRWQVGIDSSDMVRFQEDCFDPLLENVLDDYEWWSYIQSQGEVDHWDWETRMEKFPKHQNRHFRFPFGIFNPLTEDGRTEYDDYLATGNDSGLVKTTNLFPELTGA